MDKLLRMKPKEYKNVWVGEIGKKVSIPWSGYDDFTLVLPKNYDDFVGLWSNALYHYGIGIENGLKGIIIKMYPEAVNFEVAEDDVILHDIGGKASKSHDLYTLANRAGILGKNKKELPFNVNLKLTKNVLQNLSDIIRWASKYPIPISSSKVFQMDEDVPHVCVYGFHILDTIGFFFDYFKLQVESD